MNELELTHFVCSIALPIELLTHVTKQLSG